MAYDNKILNVLSKNIYYLLDKLYDKFQKINCYIVNQTKI